MRSTDVDQPLRAIASARLTHIFLCALTILASTAHPVIASTHRSMAHRSHVVARVHVKPLATRFHAAPRAARTDGALAGRVRPAAPLVPVALANTTWDDPALTPAVVDAIQAAARVSGIDPGLLLTVAWRESRFDPGAENDRSSARGLLQFTSTTWLQTVRDLGSDHGLSSYAAAIDRDQTGALTVRDPRLRAEILGLRRDPVLSATLAAEAMARRRPALEALLGRPASHADLYLLHVLGTTGAARFLSALAKRPRASILNVAGAQTLRNAGLLASDGTAASVARTYAAIVSLLDEQRARSETLLALGGRRPDAGAAKLVEVSEAP